MRTIRLFRTAALVLGGVLLLILLTYWFIPTGRINAVIDRALENRGLSLAPGAHKKALPGLEWDNPMLSSRRGALVGCDRASLRLRLAPLLLGRVKLGLTAAVRNGRVEMEYSPNGQEVLSVDASGVNLADIPLFKTALSGNVAGELRVTGLLRRGQEGVAGEFRLEVKQLGFSGVKLGTLLLPDVSDLHCRGMIRIADNRRRLESFSIQGSDVYVRLSGEIPSGSDAMDTPLDLTAEVMPKPVFWERHRTVFLLLSRFMVSPGNYRIPIRGTLLKPEIF